MFLFLQNQPAGLDVNFYKQKENSFSKQQYNIIAFRDEANGLFYYSDVYS